MANIVKIKDVNGNWIDLPFAKGVNGITPHMGDNGNWWIGDVDTGVSVITEDRVLELINTQLGVIENGTY